MSFLSPLKMRRLMQALLQNHSIKSLKLDSSELFKTHVSREIAEYLSDSQASLQSLEWKFNTRGEDDLGESEIQERKESLSVLFNGLDQNKSITQLQLDCDLISFFDEAITKLLQNNHHLQSFRISSYYLDEENIEPILAGLSQNHTLRSLEFDYQADDGPTNYCALTRMLTLPESAKQKNNASPTPYQPPCSLEKLSLHYRLKTGEELDSLCSFIRRPIPSLKAMKIVLRDFDGDFSEALLEALTESGSKSATALESFTLNVRYDCQIPQLYRALVRALPRIANLSCLRLYAESDDEIPNALPDEVLDALESNTSLTSVTLDPFDHDSEPFAAKTQAFCIRNKVNKALAGFSTGSLPFSLLPSILKTVQQNCEELGVQSDFDRYKASLINIYLRRNMDPKMIEAISSHL